MSLCRHNWPRIRDKLLHASFRVRFFLGFCAKENFGKLQCQFENFTTLGYHHQFVMEINNSVMGDILSTPSLCQGVMSAGTN